MATQLTEKQIKLAVNWWANVIQHPKFDAGAGTDPRMKMKEHQAMLNAVDISQEDVNIFKLRLTNLLANFNDNNYLSVDYKPCSLLAGALQETNIPASNFPWKTNMWFDGGNVSVSYGYCADTVILEEYLKTEESFVIELEPGMDLASEFLKHGVVLDTPGHVDLYPYQADSLKQIREQGVQVIDIAPEGILPTVPEQQPWFAQDSQSVRKAQKERSVPNVKQEQPYELTSEQEKEQTALWTFVISIEAARIAKNKPVSVLRSALKKLRHVTPLKKKFTRKILKIAIKNNDAWLVTWADSIVQAAIHSLQEAQEQTLDTLLPVNLDEENTIVLEQQSGEP